MRRLTHCVAVLLAGLVAATVLVVVAAAPGQAQRIRPTYWGMHDTNWVTPPSVPVGAANLTTSSTYWHQVESAPLVYDLAKIAVQVEAAQQVGATPMIVLGGTPAFHSTDLTQPDRTDMPRMPSWTSYVRAVVTTFGADLDYQIWPEPNIVQNWTGTPGQMARLTAAASRVIRGVAPRATVVAPALTLRKRSQRRWMQRFFAQRVDGRPVASFVDVVALDTFPEQSGSPEDAHRLVRTATKQLRRLGVRKPLWNNEINYGVAGGGEPTTTSYSRDLQQSFVIRTYALSAAARMARTYWLGWFKTRTMAVSMTRADGRRAAPARSYAVVRSWMNRTSFRGCERRRNGVWVCTARTRKEVRRIYWKPSGSAAVRTHRSTRRLEDMDGRTTKARRAVRLRVDFRPVMVASRR